jgi:predicted transcriptional regulator
MESTRRNMISFACKTINVQEVIRCSFELTKTEYELLRFLLGKKRMSISDISKQQGFERSTVQKALQGLQKKNLATRRQINLAQGGYQYVYEVKDKQELQRNLIMIINTWHQNVEEAVKTWT